MKHLKLFENYLESKYELIGDSLDDILDAINALKFHYGEVKNAIKFVNQCT